ncbi:MAG: hypothetical protein HYR60_31065 [Acidobacteria bacterium]|nr:hypothetical protein [Acidobacteriota bacterium]
MRWYRWWYISIGLGFLLLGLRAVIVGERPWRIAVRWLIAAAFLLMGTLGFRK